MFDRKALKLPCVWGFFGFFLTVVILCMSSVLIGGEDQRKLLLAALDMGMVSAGYVFIPYDALLYALPYQVTDHHRKPLGDSYGPCFFVAVYFGGFLCVGVGAAR